MLCLTELCNSAEKKLILERTHLNLAFNLDICRRKHKHTIAPIEPSELSSSSSSLLCPHGGQLGYILFPYTFVCLELLFWPRTNLCWRSYINEITVHNISREMTQGHRPRTTTCHCKSLVFKKYYSTLTVNKEQIFNASPP